MNSNLIQKVDEAIESGNLEDLRKALEIDPAIIKENEGSWLGLSVYLGNIPVTKFMLDIGFDVNAVDMLGNVAISALDTAMTTNNPTMARFLLVQGANPRHDRVVIRAVNANAHALELVQLLHEHGADLHQVFTNEFTGLPMNALSTAIDWGKQDVIDYLRSVGCVLPGSQPVVPSTPPLTPDSAILEFCTSAFGPVQPQALIEIVRTEPPIAIHVVPPGDGRPCLTLFTTGMSAQPMPVSEGNEEFQFAELFIQLPADWPTSKDAWSNPEHGWPIRWLRQIAKYPHQNDTWLGGPAAVFANEDPPQPLAPGMGFAAMFLIAEKQFVASDRGAVQFYRMVPMYAEEWELHRREGIGALARALDQVDTPFVVTPNRRNAAK